MRIWIGVILAAIAMYAWGFAYWGASSIPYRPWNATADDHAAGQALLEHFPESGVYYIPANSNAAAQRSELYESGPVGFVFIDRDGRPELDPGIMVRGFLLNLVVAALLAWVFRLAGAAVPTHGGRLGLAAVIGLVFVVLVHGGDVVWWVLPLGWEFSQGFYNFTAFMLGAIVLTRFVPSSDGARA